MRLIHDRKFYGCLLVAALLIGCGSPDQNENHDPPVPVAEPADLLDLHSPGTPTDTPTTRQFHGISFVIPPGWIPLPDSQFYDAKFTIPHEAGEMQLTLTTMGGGTDLNLERWVGQFQLPEGETPRRESIDIAGRSASWIDLRGTFRNQMAAASGNQSDWRLLGVALPLDESDFYLKLTGPKPAVTEFEEQFRAFLDSATIGR